MAKSPSCTWHGSNHLENDLLDVYVWPWNIKGQICSAPIANNEDFANHTYSGESAPSELSYLQSVLFTWKMESPQKSPPLETRRLNTLYHCKTKLWYTRVNHVPLTWYLFYHRIKVIYISIPMRAHYKEHCSLVPIVVVLELLMYRYITSQLKCSLGDSGM